LTKGKDMNNTLTFYSVSQAEVDSLLSEMTVVDGNTPTEGILRGRTPLGEVAGSYDFHPASGMLHITITEKPFILTMSHIEGQIRQQLDAAKTQVQNKQVVVTPAIPPTVKPVPVDPHVISFVQS
jgi:hypothetical protein